MKNNFLELTERIYDLSQKIKELESEKKALETLMKKELSNGQTLTVDRYIVSLSKAYKVESINAKAWRETCPKSWEHVHERFSKDYTVSGRLTVKKVGD